MGTGQPNGAKGGPELGLCGFCGGTGSVWSLTGEHPLAATVESLRSELEAVKREAVEALKHFAELSEKWKNFDGGGAGVMVRLDSLRAASAFVKKHGGDGNG
jgi:hypothetical protein